MVRYKIVRDGTELRIHYSQDHRRRTKTLKTKKTDFGFAGTNPVLYETLYAVLHTQPYEGVQHRTFRDLRGSMYEAS